MNYKFKIIEVEAEIEDGAFLKVCESLKQVE